MLDDDYWRNLTLGAARQSSVLCAGLPGGVLVGLPLVFARDRFLRGRFIFHSSAHHRARRGRNQRSGVLCLRRPGGILSDAVGRRALVDARSGTQCGARFRGAVQALGSVLCHRLRDRASVRVLDAASRQEGLRDDRASAAVRDHPGRRDDSDLGRVPLLCGPAGLGAKVRPRLGTSARAPEDQPCPAAAHRAIPRRDRSHAPQRPRPGQLPPWPLWARWLVVFLPGSSGHQNTAWPADCCDARLRHGDDAGSAIDTARNVSRRCCFPW